MRDFKVFCGRGWKTIRVDYDRRPDFPDRVEYAYVIARTKKRALELLQIAAPDQVSQYELNIYWHSGGDPKNIKHFPREESVIISRDEYPDDEFRILAPCPDCGTMVKLDDPLNTVQGRIQWADCSSCEIGLVSVDGESLEPAAP